VSEHQKLVKRGWSEAGAQFLIDHKANTPVFMLRKLFGEMIERRPPKEKCSRCGYKGPALDWHHVHGRKNSGETIVLCANCHREVHAGEPLERL
jgi:lipopolysaccharide biosynthesis regulator YciM